MTAAGDDLLRELGYRRLADAAERERRVDEALAERVRRTTPLSLRGPQFFIDRCAQHEAAHVVVAQAFGLRVREAVVKADGTGHTEHDHGTAAQDLAVAVAGDLWVSTFAEPHYADEYERSCTDRVLAARAGDGVTVAAAHAVAHRILAENAGEVRRVADQLRERRPLSW